MHISSIKNASTKMYEVEETTIVQDIYTNEL